MIPSLGIFYSPGAELGVYSFRLPRAWIDLRFGIGRFIPATRCLFRGVQFAAFIRQPHRFFLYTGF
jgi:hypothetical protein